MRTEENWKIIEENKKLPSQQLAKYCKKVANMAGFNFKEDNHHQGKNYWWSVSGKLDNIKIGANDKKYYNALSQTFGNDPEVQVLDNKYILNWGAYEISEDKLYLEIKHHITGIERKVSKFSPNYQSEYEERKIQVLDNKISEYIEKERELYPNLVQFLRAPMFFALSNYNTNQDIDENIMGEINSLGNSRGQVKN